MPSVDVPPLISGEGISGANLRTRGSIGSSFMGEIVANYGRFVRRLPTWVDGLDRSRFFLLHRDEKRLNEMLNVARLDINRLNRKVDETLPYFY